MLISTRPCGHRHSCPLLAAVSLDVRGGGGGGLVNGTSCQGREAGLDVTRALHSQNQEGDMSIFRPS